MITALVSSIIGMIGGIIPDVLKEMRDSRDAKRELALLQLRHKIDLERTDKQASYKIQEARYVADAADAASFAASIKEVLAAQPMHSGYAWLDACNAALRPLCTMMIIALFAFVTLGFSDVIPASMFAPVFLEAVAAVLGFLFGYRSSVRRAA